MLILAVRGFRKPIEEISQEELNTCLHVSTHLRGLQLQKFINEIRTSGSHNVCFRRSASLNKTFAQMCTANTLLDKLEVEKFALNVCLIKVVPRTIGLALKFFKRLQGIQFGMRKSRP